jgi:ribonuclease HI
MMADRQSLSVATDSQAMEPSLGVFYYVQRVDESWHVAEVIQKRENFETKEQEFYVHYKECKYRTPTIYASYVS